MTGRDDVEGQEAGRGKAVLIFVGGILAAIWLTLSLLPDQQAVAIREFLLIIFR